MLVHSRYIWNKLKEWHLKHYREYPWRAPDISPWGILLAEMLLRRTDGPTVAKVFPKLYASYPTPQDMVAANKDDVLEIIRPLGLWGQRVLALTMLSEVLVDLHKGKVPKNFSKLLALPHVGPYAAGAVSVFAFGQPAPMPDINIIRIMSRFFCLPYLTPGDIRAIARAALDQCPQGRAREFFYALLDLGSAHCRARPRCPGCPLERGCRSRMGVPLLVIKDYVECKVAENSASYSCLTPAKNIQLGL